MDQNQKATLQWFLDFLGMDLDALTLGDRLKLTADTWMITRGIHPEYPATILKEMTRYASVKTVERLLQEGVGDPLSFLDLLKRCQDRLRSLLDRIEEAVIIPILEGKREPLKETSSYPFLPTIEKQPKESKSPKWELTDEDIRTIRNLFKGKEIETIQDQVNVEVSILRQSSADPLSHIAKVKFQAATYENTFVISFLNALDGIPIAAIRKCPECGKRFFHESKRVKEFCSNRCAARKVSRSHRRRLKEEKPEKYDKEKHAGRERAHRSYAARVRKDHPKAKVERRPRKK